MANTAALQITSQILSNGPISQQLKFTVTFVRNGDSFYGSSIPLQIKCGTQQKTINVNIAQQSQVQVLTTASFTVPKTQGNTSLTVMASIARTALPPLIGRINITIPPKTYYEVKLYTTPDKRLYRTLKKWHDEALIMPSQFPQKVDHDFVYWNDTVDGSGSIKIPAGGRYATNKSISLFAQYVPNTWEIIFNPNGGDSNRVTKGSKKKDQDFVIPANATPTRKGYTFLGWGLTDVDTKVTYNAGDNYVLNKNITLYAIWEPKKYTLTFNPNRGTVTALTKQVTFNTPYGELPIPEYDDYEFQGWYSKLFGGKRITADSIYDIPSNGMIYAQWRPPQHQETTKLSPKAKFVPIGEYTFGDKNDKLCKNFTSNQEGYDSITHEKLGDYLRALRDMYGLNLMPLYNCFSNNPFAQYHIFEDRIVKTNYDYHTQIYKIPIRFNTDYTVCIENVGATTFAPAFIRNESLLKLEKTKIGNNLDVTNRYISLYTNDVISTYSGLRFFDPIVIRFDNVPGTKYKTYLSSSGNKTTAPVALQLSKCFDPIQILSSDEFDSSKEFLYKKTALSSTSKGFEYLGINSTLESAGGIGTYYTCNVNPNKLNWKDSATATEPTADTRIDVTKTYYTDVEEQEEFTYIYDIEDVHCEMYDSIEDNLYLLIQVPKGFDSNIVVLEGDYTHTKSLKYYNEHSLRDYPENYLDKLFIHDIRLMRMNVQQKIPFSDTLIQFLLWNAICGLDSINLDMDRLLESFHRLYTTIDEHYYANYWYFRYRELISNYSKLNEYEYIDDNLGYVTSEIEALLNRR